MEKIKVVLVGQPNTGKSSLINSITDAHLKVGNFAGVTVEKTEISIVRDNFELIIIDLPGIYSLNNFTLEEQITKNFLENQSYDIILNVVDSTNLERNLALSAQILDLEKKTIVALNMWDEVQKEKITIDDKQLSELLGVLCIPISTSNHFNIDYLIRSIIDLYKNHHSPPKRNHIDFLQSQIQNIENFLVGQSYYEVLSFLKLKNQSISLNRLSLMLLSTQNKTNSTQSNQSCSALSNFVKTSIKSLCQFYKEDNISDILALDALNFAKITTQKVLVYPKKSLNYTDKIDSILLHKYFGLPIFLLLMFILFYASFMIGGALQDYLDNIIKFIGNWFKEVIPDKNLSSLIGDGIIGGTGAVISFLPLIVILYFGISLLETTGYMSRVSFLLDGIFHKFGLHGKSFIPLVTGFGCSVPAYMATRTLQNKNERLITLFIIGFMSCSARLPIYVLFIAAFFSDKYAGIILFCIYILGSLIALLAAVFLKLSIFKGKEEPFVMEMPKYRLPSWKTVWFSVWSQSIMYLKKAGTFILIGSVLIWFASQYPKNQDLQDLYQKKIMSIKENSKLIPQEQEKYIADLNNKLSSALLKQSYAGRIGTFLQPIFIPMDFDWRLSISLITGFAAKEIVVSTLGVLYSLGDSQDENSTHLREMLRKNISIPSAVAFIIFIIFYIPCFAATIVFCREAGGVKLVLYLFIFTTLTAYILSLIGFYITKYLMFWL